jgi:hypothetical protein
MASELGKSLAINGVIAFKHGVFCKPKWQMASFFCWLLFAVAASTICDILTARYCLKYY